MISKKIFCFAMMLMIGLFPLVFAENVSPKAPASSETQAFFTARQIKPGDTLKISVWKYSDLNTTVTVEPDGYVSCAYLGDILVAGKTVEELRQIVTKKLDQQFIANPRVDIQLDTPPPVIFVAGEVVRPGSYEYQPGLDPLKAIALAGGFTDFASHKAVIIRKGANGKDLEIKADLNNLMKAAPDREQYVLQAGDVVIIKRSWF